MRIKVYPDNSGLITAKGVRGHIQESQRESKQTSVEVQVEAIFN